MWTSSKQSELVNHQKELDDERFSHYSEDVAAYSTCAPAPSNSLKAGQRDTGTFKLEIPVLKTASVSRMIERSGFLQNDLCPLFGESQTHEDNCHPDCESALKHKSTEKCGPLNLLLKTGV